MRDAKLLIDMVNKRLIKFDFTYMADTCATEGMTSMTGMTSVASLTERFLLVDVN